MGCESRWRAALAAYGVLAAAAYASLLPLWEGYDEPFHFAYLQKISRDVDFPVRGKTGVSEEVRASLPLAPASHVVARNIPGLTTFAEWFRLPEEERQRRRAGLRAIPPSLGARLPDDGTNYEAQQAPLAYILMAPLERLWAGLPLPQRVWRIRVAAGAAAAVAAALGTLALAAQLGVSPVWAAWMAFLLLSSQMFYAASAHVTNDWLAIALAPWLLAAGARYAAQPRARNAAVFGCLLAAGLLAKAYYLAFVPLAIGLALWKRRGAWALVAAAGVLAGPWYWRNWALYGTVTGALETIVQHSFGEIAGGLWRMPWGAALASSARRSLWNANNSFDTFSAATLNLMLLLAAVGLALYLRAAWRRRPGWAEGVLIAACVLFAGALAYSTSALYLVFGEEGLSGAPWYTPAIYPAVFGLIASGASRSGAAGRWLAVAMAAMWTYLFAATWWVKLIPLYGGFGGRARIGPLAAWYRSGTGMLGDTAMLPAPAVVTLAAVATAASVALAAALSRHVLRADLPQRPQLDVAEPDLRAL